MEIKTVEPGFDAKDAAVICGVLASGQALPGSEDYLEAVDGSFLEISGFQGKAGQVVSAPSERGVVILAGIGDEGSFESVRAAAGNAIRVVKADRVVCLLTQAPIEDVTRAVVEGIALGSYQFRPYKTADSDQHTPTTVELVGASQGSIDETLVGVDATALARDWVNTPAMDKSPEEIAATIGLAAEGSGVQVEVWDRARIEEEKLGALLGVAAGSSRPPVLMVLSYEPERADRHLGLVGKGITFDSGGLSLKSAAFMEEMKDDMAGGAAVAAATIGIARLGLPIRVTTVIPFTDNAVGGNATRPGDVLRPVSGPTIEVLNTDAEGRLILADGLGVVRKSSPDFIVDVATLTGAAKVALGERIGAVFASGPEVAERVLGAASRAGEYFWEMPLFDEYRKALDSNIADIKNISGSRYGGAIAAALFLKEYAGDGDWAHLDIAGPARARETAGENVKGASGAAVRTLIEIARGLSESN